MEVGNQKLGGEGGGEAEIQRASKSYWERQEVQGPDRS